MQTIGCSRATAVGWINQTPPVYYCNLQGHSTWSHGRRHNFDPPDNFPGPFGAQKFDLLTNAVLHQNTSAPYGSSHGHQYPHHQDAEHGSKVTPDRNGKVFIKNFGQNICDCRRQA